MKIKAVCLKGRTVISADGKCRWTEDGQTCDVNDAVGAQLLATAPKGMFEAASSTKKEAPKPEPKVEEAKPEPKVESKPEKAKVEEEAPKPAAKKRSKASSRKK